MATNPQREADGALPTTREILLDAASGVDVVYGHQRTRARSGGNESDRLFSADCRARPARRGDCVAAIAAHFRWDAGHGDDRCVAWTSLHAGRASFAHVISGDTVVQIVCEPRVAGGPRGAGGVDRPPGQRGARGRRDDEFGAGHVGAVDSYRHSGGWCGCADRIVPCVVCATGADRVSGGGGWRGRRSSAR